VDGFGEISQDNKRIITMEWIVEGVTLIFIGVLVSLVTMVTTDINAARMVYLISGITLIVLALVSVFTGFRVDFLPYKLCPLIFTLSAVLILLGAYL
jgi:predicted RND superfamily exporter protein